MLSKPIFVDHEVSIQKMLRLDDNDNILISRADSIRKYHDMLLGRLNNTDRHSIRIHLCPNLLNVDLEQYRPYVEAGAEVYLWQHRPEKGDISSGNLISVHVAKKKTALYEEGFVILRTATSSRMLAVWKDDQGQVSGVLVTNPRTVEEISDRLDMIIKAAAG